MKIVVAPDSFKGSMSARQAAEAIAAGFRRIYPAAEYELIPMADGGEGSVRSLVDATGGRLVSTSVTGPLGVATDAVFGMLGDDVLCNACNARGDVAGRAAGNDG